MEQITKDVLNKMESYRGRPFYNGLLHHVTSRNRRLNFKKWPSMTHLYLNDNPEGCIMKSTQGGVSEWLLVKGFTDVMQDKNIFWVLPDDKIKTRFVAERFDKTFKNTKLYRDYAIQNGTTVHGVIYRTGIKNLGRGTFNIVGSKNQSSFTEFVADCVVIDEYDRCDLRNVAMARDRIGMSEYREYWAVSNPTTQGFGIDELYSKSNMMIWEIQCETCERYVELIHSKYS